MTEEIEQPLEAGMQEIAAHKSNGQEASPEESAPKLSVIGIGASAGGLAAVRGLFAALPDDSGLVFVVVMHLSPQHESRLAELVQPYTKMPVMQVTERTKMEPGHVYIIPPGKRLLVSDNHLEVVEFENSRGPHLQIDDFFRSLAEEHGDGVAILLSGSGSDGSVGIQRVKEKGGLIFAQSPQEAEFDGMPRSAMATGLVDVVGSVAMLAKQVVAAKRTYGQLDLPDISRELPAPARQTLAQILDYLHARTGHDFSGYKEATMRRRIARRMQLANIPTLSAYLEQLRENYEETDALFRDLLIHVTEFFRDSEAWDYLAQEVIPALFAGKTEESSVRVWVVGCASGEEVYGLAMLLLEQAETLQNPPQMQIFASDIGEAALNYARACLYPKAIEANVSEERLARFFEQENSHYRVRKNVRDLVLFSPHNLLQDPPFSRLDLLICRNLLIYLQRPLQEQAFESFHYALRPNGYLFLGSAESADGISHLFEPVHRQHRVYRRRNPAPHDKLSLPTPSALPPQGRAMTAASFPKQAELSADEHLRSLEEAGLPSLLVSEQYTVLHYSETAGRYLQHPAGLPTQNVIRLVRPELESELLAALHHAFAEAKPARTPPVPVQFNGAPHLVTVLVRPVPEKRHALIFFWEEDTGAPEQVQVEETHQAAAKVRRLEVELRTAQQRLQATHEQYDATVEELGAANEELQSTNEEYRATLEELETGEEELQSINEELHTVNQELINKIEEVNLAHSDLQNLFVSTGIATLFLDRQLRVNRYTPRAAEIFNLMPTDQWRPIEHLSRTIEYPMLEADARQVLASLVPIEREVQDEAGRWFLASVRPYRTIDNKIEGVVITFVDISDNKESAVSLQKAKHFAETIVNTVPDSLLILDTDLCVVSANDSFYATFQVTLEETEGKLIYALGNGQWDFPELRRLLEEVLPSEQRFTRYQIEHIFEKIGPRSMLLNGRRLDYQGLVLLTIAELSATQRIHEISMQLLLETNLDKLLDEILDAAIEILGADMGNLQMLDAEAQELYLRGQRGFEEPFLHYFGRISFESDTSCTEAMRAAKRVVVPDIQSATTYTSEGARDVLEEAGVRAVQSTPLVSRDGTLLGVISTHWRTPHTPNEHELHLLDLLARQAADLIERAQTETALQEWANRLEERVEERTQQIQIMAHEILRVEQHVQQRIALVLHDDLQQQLYSTRMQLEMVRDELSQLGSAKKIDDAFAGLDSMVANMIELTRKLTRDLAPPTLHHDDLGEALKWLVARMQEMHALAVTLEVQDNPPVPHEITLLTYHCVRELLFNIVKHADVNEARISVQQVGQSLHVIISDHGAGFDATNLQRNPSTTATGYGLLHMRERLAYLNADLKIESTPGEGTQAEIILPLHDSESSEA